jgi:hypothetical protein
MKAPPMGLLVKRSTTFPTVNPIAYRGMNKKRTINKMIGALEKWFTGIESSPLLQARP